MDGCRGAGDVVDVKGTEKRGVSGDVKRPCEPKWSKCHVTRMAAEQGDRGVTL